MVLPPPRSDREYRKFVENSAGDVAVRTTLTDFSGDINANVENTAISTTGLAGKASGTNADFTTAFASATTLTCSSLPSGTSSIEADDITSIYQIATDGSVTKVFFRDDSTFASSGTDPSTITVTGATFISSDTFVVYTNIQRATESVARLDLEGVGDVTIGTSEVAIAITGTPTSEIRIRADTGNTGIIFISKTGVLSDGTNDFVRLNAGDEAILNYDDATNALFAISDTAAQTINVGALL